MLPLHDHFWLERTLCFVQAVYPACLVLECVQTVEWLLQSCMFHPRFNTSIYLFQCLSTILPQTSKKTYFYLVSSRNMQLTKPCGDVWPSEFKPKMSKNNGIVFVPYQPLLKLLLRGHLNEFWLTLNMYTFYFLTGVEFGWCSSRLRR